MAREIVRPFNRKLLPERLGHEVIDSDHMEISNCWYRAVNCGTAPISIPDRTHEKTDAKTLRT
jgi:hypothetical protein